jgi:uncharacterized protein YndB with AHSA1/START domain
MRRTWLAALVLAAPVAAQPAPPPPPVSYGSFEVVIDQKLDVPPDVAWDRLVHVERWWHPSHSYSGDAANLSLDPRAGGCWCETWPGGSVEHARVLTAMPGKLLRVEGAFGPLQAQPVVAILSFGLKPAENGKATLLAVRYRVAGAVGTLGPPVTEVLTTQIEHLVAGLNTPPKAKP